MMNELTYSKAHAAVECVRKTALANEVTREKLAMQIGMSRQTLAERFKEGDMKLTEFVSASQFLNLDPARVLDEAQQAA